MRAPGLLFALVVAAATGLVPSRASALAWPDVAARIERDLQASDALTRRRAAHELAGLGLARGGPLALQALQDADDDVRIAAADAAIRLHVAGATDEMVAWLNAGDPRLRRKACEVARALPSARVVAPLARSLGDADADVRAAAADALGHQGSADAVPPLLGRLDDPSPSARVQIVEALARLGDPRAVVPLVGKIQDSSPDVRQAVARALGGLGDARATPALILGLRDQNLDVRRDALAALGRLRSVDAVDAIAPFVDERNAGLRASALAALGTIGSPAAVRLLVQALGASEDAGGGLDRDAVRDALVQAGTAAIAPLHAVLTGSPSPPVATSAAWVMGALGATPEAPTLVGAMRRGVLPPAAALRALRGAGTSEQLPVVLEYVADPSPVVRDEAIDAAGALLDPHHPDGRAVEPLAAALRDVRPTAPQRARMATLLGRTGASRAAPLLVDLTKAQEPSLRLAAVEALGLLGPADDRATENALLEALASADPAVRRASSVALALAGRATSRDALLAKLDGGDEVDRAAVLTALGGVMARESTDAAVARLEGALSLAAGPERDAILDAIAGSPSKAAEQALLTAARSTDAGDRREVAVVVAGRPADAAVMATLRALAADPDEGVRAEAAWTLGSLGDASDEPRLVGLLHAPEVDAAADAAAALGRIAARLHGADLATRALCPVVIGADERRSLVRANAFAGLALAGARCDGDADRRALAEDPSEDVRAAAADLAARSSAPEATRALDLCARFEPSGTVARRCRATPPVVATPGPLLVYVLPDGASAPAPGSSFALLMSDGLLHLGGTDRRGAVFDPAAPSGTVSLRPSTARR